MSQNGNPEKNEKNHKKEKKSKEDTKYNKPPEVIEILNELYNEWSREGYRSPNKEKICYKYLDKLKERGYQNYKVEELKQYCNNHRHKPTRPREQQNGSQNITMNQPQQFFQEMPQSLQNYSQQEMMQPPNNQNYYQLMMLQPQNVMQPFGQQFSQQNSLTQFPNQVYSQQSQQIPSNQAYSQQQMLSQQIFPNQSQQQFQFNQAFSQQQPFQQQVNQPFPQQMPLQSLNNQIYPQQMMQPVVNESYSQQQLLQVPSNQQYQQQQSLLQPPNQSYQQQQLQPSSDQVNIQQQLHPNLSYSQNQLSHKFSNQAYPQPQSQQIIPNQSYSQKHPEQPQQPQSNQQEIESQESQQISPTQIALQQEQPKQSYQFHPAKQNSGSFSSTPISPKMSEILLKSDSNIFSSDSSQFMSIGNSESSDSNSNTSQLQNSSKILDHQISVHIASNQTQNPADGSAINEDSENSENKYIYTNRKNENNIESQNESENSNTNSTEIQNYNNNNNNDYNADDESDNEDDGNDEINENYDSTNNKSKPKKNTDIELTKRVVLRQPHGGKQVGKSYYFPPDSIYTSYSSSSNSPLTFSLPYKLQSSADKKNSDDDLIQKLPDIIIPQGELNSETFDIYKNEIYTNFKNCYKYIHEAASFYHQEHSPDGKIIFNQKLFNFQKEVEIRFVSFTNLLTNDLNIGQIGSLDQYCSRIDIKPRKNILSRTTRLYSGEILSAFPSRSNSQATESSASEKDVEMKSSSNVKTKSVKFDNSVNNIYNNHDNGEIGIADCAISSYIGNGNIIKRFKLNEKLQSLYLGKHNDKARYSIDITNAEAVDIISYSYKPESNSENGEDDIMICEYAYVNYFFNSHVLNLKGAKCDTGFIGPVQSMYFHRSNNVNKIYLCGDIRMKEFTINGLDEDQEIVIENTNTFFFGIDKYHTTAITIWDKEAVLAVDSKIFFWNIEDDSNYKKDENLLNTNANKELIRQSGIDESKVDWTRGKYFNSTTINITTDGMQQITSLAIIGNSSEESYLAVSSINYPVIYIYNKEHQNISRLVSHTMGVSCIKSFNYQLFSGSLDLVARLWDVNNGEPILWFNTKCERIYAIEPAFYCGKMIFFTGGKDNAVQCFSISDKKPLFEIKLNENLVPRKISFITGKNKVYGDYAKLMIISECISQNNLKNYQVHYFEFI